MNVLQQVCGVFPYDFQSLKTASEIVYQAVSPTLQNQWPLLSQRLRCEVWVKHENHTPVGSFKVRGGLVYLHKLYGDLNTVSGIISATRGNHGQSLGFAALRYGLDCTIVVPHGNSLDKNKAMKALGVNLIEYGKDIHEAVDYAKFLSQEKSYHFVPSFHPWLVQGVASYSLELFSEIPDLETLYVPIGQGSGICGAIAARDALGLKTKIVGVVSEKADAYAKSFKAGKAVSTMTADTIADGIACRVPAQAALDIILEGAERVMTVSDESILDAMKILHSDAHNLSEGAGAAGLAALMAEREAMRGKKVGIILSGGNVDSDLYRKVLS